MQYRFGPLLDTSGVTFQLWAPDKSPPQLLLENRPAETMACSDGFWTLRVEGVGPGARYRFRLEGEDFPDPAAREQDGADGWSIVRGPFGREPHPGPLRPWHETILCEVHVGTATPEGTYVGLMNRLEHFRDAGYTGLELMPLNTFPGDRGWGYDGTLLFAPHKPYGTPEELRALVDRAHDLGLCMVLDVVYNHFGDAGNAVPYTAFGWFDPESKTPWGPAIDFRKPEIRKFYCENAAMWLAEYDFDGLRFDAVHEFATEARDLFLGELARACRAIKPDAKLVTENVRNEMHWLTRDGDNRPRDYSAQWNDDYHHVLQFLVTGEPMGGYEEPDRDPVADLEKSLADGFVHDGDAGPDSDGRTRSEPASELPMEAFIGYLQNHDQIGNRPDNKRIVERVDAERLDFGHFVTLLSPQIPMFFMGEEAHQRCPFLFFFDLPEPWRSEKRENRYWQMEYVFHNKVEPGSLPDPQALQTFEKSKLDWDAYGQREHLEAMARFRELTAMRRELIWPLTATKCLSAWSARQGDAIIVTWQYEAGFYNMLLNPTGAEALVEISLAAPAASTGRFEFHGSKVKIWPWSALVWRS